ncbi:hypothetical protein L2E82_27286 [Cichorium intybus]|uniref:Uncharacterized protein n=1 Tax=Cichorium intybus TaxID=13427 RepID=A0ACB9CSJ0_CICIN|nr:hypothetical protein L2E82_27286 [Cichorium intybus]
MVKNPLKVLQSPYPRGYYRCSTSKGCLARKQVERNRSDPDMFIVTYTGEHSHPVPTHRNFLAGSTRNKPATSDTYQLVKDTKKELHNLHPDVVPYGSVSLCIYAYIPF